NRLGSVATRVPAMVMNILPMRLEIDEEAPLTEVVTQAARTLAAMRRHGQYRGEQIRRDLKQLGEDRRLYGPLINPLPFEPPPPPEGLTTEVHTMATGPVDDITFEVRGDLSGERLQLEIQANPRLYRQEMIEAHRDRLATFLERAVRAERLADVPTLTPSEHERWAIDVNRTDYPVEDTTLTRLIERAMRRTPDATALVFQGRAMSYAELDLRTEELARRLVARGVGRETVVAVALNRSLELVISLVAILRAGG